MHTQKRKVALEDGMILYGVGVRSVVKYIVKAIPEKKAFRLYVVGESGSNKSFMTKLTEFYEGTTIYKHGYRMFRHSASVEKKYVTYLVKHNLYSKLQKIQAIMERAHQMSPDKMFALALLCDNMLRDAAKIDRRIKIKTH